MDAETIKLILGMFIAYILGIVSGVAISVTPEEILEEYKEDKT